MTPAELHIIRKNYGLTQEDFGKKLNPPVSRLTVYNWEKGKFAIPADLEQRMAKADLAAPIIKKSASKPVEVSTHPACYHQCRKNSYARTLLHPKWWAGVGTPFSRLCSEAEWKLVDPVATVLDLATYIAPTIEQAHALMVSRGLTHNEASSYLEWMGYTLPVGLALIVSPEQQYVTAYNVAFAQWQEDHPGDGFGPFEAANPQWRENKPATPVGEIDSALKAALDSAFQTPSNKE